MRQRLTVFTLIVCGGCGLFPRIPIQALRVVQLETYTQDYRLNSKELRGAFEVMLGACNMEVLYTLALSGLPKNSEEHKKFGQYLKSLQNNNPNRTCGPADLSLLKNTSGSLPELLASKSEEKVVEPVVVRGALTFGIVPNGIRPNEFIINGWGRYFVYVAASGELLASAQFNVEVDKVHSIDELERSKLVLEIPARQWATREFARAGVPYIAESRLVVRLHIRSPILGVYEIDYDAGHEVFLDVDAHAAHSELREGRMPIGQLKFDVPSTHDGLPRKLLDVRMVESWWLEHDYHSFEEKRWRVSDDRETKR